MRVLAHIHTFNDADIIDRTIEAMRRQTRPVEGILVVDNASTDGTLDRPSIANVIVLRHPENRGTSGAVVSGLRFAIEQNYDWLWVFDADSVPEPDALERLLDLYTRWPRSLQDEIGFVTCLPLNGDDSVFFPGAMFTRCGTTSSAPTPDARYYLCQFTLWSGCLYCLSSVVKVGLPNPDYVLDWGEMEYGYRVMKAGYKGFMHQDAILHHNIRGYASRTPVEVRRGATTVTVYEYPAIRVYYSCRNILYFALYDFGEGRVCLVLRTLFSLAVVMLHLLVRPLKHRKQIVACCRAIWHGVTGNIAARY